jgi:hypothetical protein
VRVTKSQSMETILLLYVGVFNQSDLEKYYSPVPFRNCIRLDATCQVNE